jgi:hypothetical protein
MSKKLAKDEIRVGNIAHYAGLRLCKQNGGYEIVGIEGEFSFPTLQEAEIAVLAFLQLERSRALRVWAALKS